MQDLSAFLTRLSLTDSGSDALQLGRRGELWRCWWDTFGVIWSRLPPIAVCLIATSVDGLDNGVTQHRKQVLIGGHDQDPTVPCRCAAVERIGSHHVRIILHLAAFARRELDGAVSTEPLDRQWHRSRSRTPNQDTQDLASWFEMWTANVYKTCCNL